MTTTVIIKTYGFPVKLIVNDALARSSPTSRIEGYSTTTEFVTPNTEREITVTDTRSISVEELPADWIDLDGRKAPPPEPVKAENL